MADEIKAVEVAAPPDNAARISFKNVVTVPADELAAAPVDEGAQVEGADEETVAEDAGGTPAPQEPQEPQEPLEHGEKLRLAELRKADASFDEDLIEKLLAEKAVSESAAKQAQYLYNKSPAFRKAYLTALKDDGGTLTPEEEAFIAVPEKEKKEEASAPTEKEVRDWIDAEAVKMEGTHSPVQIYRWMQRQEEKYIHGPAREKAAKEEQTRKAAEQKAQAHTAMVTQARSEGSDALAAFPKLFKKDPNAPYGVACTDKEIWAEILDQGGVKALKDATTKALKILGRNIAAGTAAPQARSAAVSAPRTNNLAPTTSKQAAPEPGMARISFKTRTVPTRR